MEKISEGNVELFVTDLRGENTVTSKEARRWTAYKAKMSIKDIAAEEGVTTNAIKASLLAVAKKFRIARDNMLIGVDPSYSPRTRKEELDWDRKVWAASKRKV